MKGKDATNIPIAGVGRPMKDVVCLSSILNLARRKAAKTARKKAAKGGIVRRFGEYDITRIQDTVKRGDLA